MTCIIDNLYLGSVENVTDIFLKNNNIHTLINVAEECEYKLSSVTDKDNIMYYHFGIIDDMYDISDWLHTIPSIINKRIHLGPILIHCKAGLSRSPTFVLAYMIKYLSMDLSTSICHLRNLCQIMPNPSFMSQLMTLETEIHNTNSYHLYIDDYIVFYIVSSLGIDTSKHDMIKNLYINSNKNIWETITKFRSLSR